MGFMDLVRSAFRDFVTDGIPATGDNKPSKRDTITVFAAVDSQIQVIVSGLVLGQAILKDTLAHLNADLAHAVDTLAIVYADTDANNGLYKKLLGTGLGSWSYVSAFTLPASVLARIVTLEGLASAGPLNADAFGPLAGRSIFDAEPSPFTYMSTDSSPPVFYVRQTDVPGTWAGPYSFGGVPGTPGAKWLTGTAVPGAGLGFNGDLYLKTDTADVYLKAAGAWSLVANIKGLSILTLNVYATLANLNADLVPAANAGAQVVADATPGNNGIYTKIGGTGTGSWTRVSSLLPAVVMADAATAQAGTDATKALNSAAAAATRGTFNVLTVGGTANALTATTDLTNWANSPGRAFMFKAALTNTASPVTIVIDSQPALTMKMTTGEDIPTGGIVKDKWYFGKVEAGAQAIIWGVDVSNDRANEWTAFGGLIGIALTDQDGKVYAVYRQDDGILRTRLGLKSSSGIVTALFDPATGYMDMGVLGVDSDDAEMVINGEVALLAFTDKDRRVYAYGRQDGAFRVKHLVADQIEGLSSGAVESTDYYFDVETVAGNLQVVRYAKVTGVRTVMTTSGINTSPHITSDGASVVYTSTRTTPASEFYQAVGGGTEYPVLASPTLVAWGNSLSTASYYVSQMARAIISQGVGGQNDDHAAARMDAVPLTCNVTGDQIPASGSVAVSGFSPDIWFHWNVTLGSFRANAIGLAGEVVPVTLTYSSGTLAMVRTTVGSAINVPHPMTLHITSGRIEGSVDASTAPSLDTLLSDTAILYPNYNSITQALAAGYSLAEIFAREVASVARLASRIKRFLIVGDYMGQARLTAARSPGVGLAANDTASKALLDATIALNAMRRAQWPANYVDLHAGLVAGGHSAPQTILGTTYDIVDLATLPDGTHPSIPTGSGYVATIITNALTSQGF